MPTALEAGTLNVPGLAGLGAGVRWLLEQGVEALHTKEMALTRSFWEGVGRSPVSFCTERWQPPVRRSSR